MHIILDNGHVTVSALSQPQKTYAPNQNLITLHNTVCELCFIFFLTALLLTGQFPEGKFQELKLQHPHTRKCFLNLLQEPTSAIILTFTSQ